MKFVVGIDEVGRGPLAGPVTTCVCVCDAAIYSTFKKSRLLPKRGIDSKKLSAREREAYAGILKELAREKKISYSVNHVSNKVIDSKGISYAIRKSIAAGIRKLKLDCRKCEVLLDGGLRAPVEFRKQRTIIKGDEKEHIIAWASIVAKVSRDSLMERAGRRYPQYGFEVHKGYGTRQHREAIRRYSPSPLHRRTWLAA